MATIQALYAFQIPGFLVGMVAARCLNALGRDRLILAVSGVNFALNVVGNWVLLRWIGLRLRLSDGCRSVGLRLRFAVRLRRSVRVRRPAN